MLSCSITFLSNVIENHVNYAKIICEADHVLFYHKSCWRNLAKKRYSGASRAECIGHICPVPECTGFIANYEELNSDGSVRKTSSRPAAINAANTGIRATHESATREVVVKPTLINEKKDANSLAPLQVEDDKNELEKDKDDVTERIYVSAYMIDLSEATVILARDRLLEVDDETSRPERRQTKRSKKKNVKGVMILAEFHEKEEVKEAEREAERLRPPIPYLPPLSTIFPITHRRSRLYKAERSEPRTSYYV